MTYTVQFFINTMNGLSWFQANGNASEVTNNVIIALCDAGAMLGDRLPTVGQPGLIMIDGVDRNYCAVIPVSEIGEVTEWLDSALAQVANRLDSPAPGTPEVYPTELPSLTGHSRFANVGGRRVIEIEDQRQEAH